MKANLLNYLMDILIVSEMGNSQFCIETLYNDNIRRRLLFSLSSPHISLQYLSNISRIHFSQQLPFEKNFILYIISMFYTYYSGDSFPHVSDG